MLYKLCGAYRQNIKCMGAYRYQISLKKNSDFTHYGDGCFGRKLLTECNTKPNFKLMDAFY